MIKNSDAEKHNQEYWDEIAPFHYNSYGLDKLKKGKSRIEDVQKKDLYPVAGKELLHLQCHIGSDSVSLALDGANVTGVDFSEQSIKIAQKLNDECGTDVSYIHSNIYDLPQVLTKQFDIVYTSKGVLAWLKDIRRWAGIVSHFLKPGGIFYILEIHPVKFLFDDTLENELKIKYSYFHYTEPLTWDDDYPDYADKTYVPKSRSYEWNWSISDIVTAILDPGLNIISLKEYDSLFYNGHPGMVKDSNGWWYLPKYKNMIPFTFSLKAEKPE